ncbi:hypothetical protein GCM10009803_15900 [Microbacterium ginsengiterrae]
MTGVIATIIILVVIAGTALIFAPSGTPLRSAVQTVAFPYFSQNWRVFAPDILKSNRTFEIRAQWRDDSGELVKSGWVSITEIEQRTVKGNLAPSRIEKNSWNASNTYLKRYLALDEAQRERVRDTFIEARDGGFRPIPVEELIADLGEGDGDVVRFLRVDYMLMRYATMYATAGFGEDIERVQWRVITEQPNDFTHRFDDERQFTPTVRTFGWRQSNLSIDPDVLAQYRGVIDRYGAVGTFERAANEAE